MSQRRYTMSEEFSIVSRPWKPQDLIDDLQMYIDEEPDFYLNGRRETMCMAQAYLKEHFAEVSGKWKYYKKQGIAVCTNCSFERKLDDDFGRAVSCPNCGAKMDGGADNAVD